MCGGNSPLRGGGIEQKVYPRVCGGNDDCTAQEHRKTGLSPRVRGKPELRNPPAPGSRSIPACAGETMRGRIRPAAEGVYPRVCGGNIITSAILAGSGGLSPRVRGKLAAPAAAPARGRSIPACAGETISPDPGKIPRKVYPRVCGGNNFPGSGENPPKGLSPRVRGKRATSWGKYPPARSIPACAGETPRRNVDAP